jgi:hypothetical protein
VAELSAKRDGASPMMVIDGEEFEAVERRAVVSGRARLAQSREVLVRNA